MHLQLPPRPFLLRQSYQIFGKRSGLSAPWGLSGSKIQQISSPHCLSVTFTLLVIPWIRTGNNLVDWITNAEPEISSQKTAKHFLKQRWIVSRLLQECSLAGGTQTKKAWVAATLKNSFSTEILFSVWVWRIMKPLEFKPKKTLQKVNV